MLNEWMECQKLLREKDITEYYELALLARYYWWHSKYCAETTADDTNKTTCSKNGDNCGGTDVLEPNLKRRVDAVKDKLLEKCADSQKNLWLRKSKIKDGKDARGKPVIREVPAYSFLEQDGNRRTLYSIIADAINEGRLTGAQPEDLLSAVIKKSELLYLARLTKTVNNQPVNFTVMLAILIAYYRVSSARRATCDRYLYLPVSRFLYSFTKVGTIIMKKQWESRNTYLSKSAELVRLFEFEYRDFYESTKNMLFYKVNTGVLDGAVEAMRAEPEYKALGIEEEKLQLGNLESGQEITLLIKENLDSLYGAGTVTRSFIAPNERTSRRTSKDNRKI